MRKAVLVLLVFSLVLGLCSCGSPSDTDKGKRTHPTPVGETVLFDGIKKEYHRHLYQLEMAVIDVVRGDEAWEIIKNADGFDEYIYNTPDDNNEYMLVKFHIKALASDDDKAVHPSDFKFVSESGIMYDFISRSDVKPALATIFPGAQTEGYICGFVNKNDTPTVVYVSDRGGGLWFQTETKK